MDQVKRDTACWSDKQWYIVGEVHGPMFSTEEDAQAAVDYAAKKVVQERYRIERRIAEMSYEIANGE